MAIQTQQFPSWRLSPETYLLTCLLHDIGTTDKNISATLMSFEFYGGLIALDLLHKQHHAPIEQAEAVAEAVIRHQDIGESGKITELGQLIQLATIFDNMGGHADLVHKGTIENVVEHFPRTKWSSCFAATIRKENGLKPWAHTTALGENEFPEGVEGNKLMAPYDG
jgi:cyanamide hydratase